MALTSTPYGQFLATLGTGGINFSSDAIWVALFNGNYQADFGNDSDYFSLRNSAEVPAEGDGTTLNTKNIYSRNGQKLTNTSWNYDPIKQAAILTADNVTWSGINATFRYVIVYKWVASSTNTTMIGCIDYGVDQIYSVQPLTIDFSDGVVALAVGTTT